MKTARAKQQIKQNQQQYCMSHMPAAMVHGNGGGVLLIMTTKLASQKTIKKTQNYIINAIKAPFLTTISNSKQTTQNQKQKQPSQQTPYSIKQTYSRDPVLSNKKDGPKMTTAQCNRPRRCGCLQCVRDGERTLKIMKTARATQQIK